MKIAEKAHEIMHKMNELEQRLSHSAATVWFLAGMAVGYLAAIADYFVWFR